MGRKKKETGETYEQRQARLEQSFDLATKEIHRREVTFDTNNYVVMANNMVLHTASNLTLNEVKLLRFFIMQTEKDDKELYQYTASVSNLAASLEISKENLYRELDKMTEHLMREVIRIPGKKKDEWLKFHWVDVCKYENGLLTVKIADTLKPFLTDLRRDFTRYHLSDIVGVNSIYAIRIYEMLSRYIDENNQPHADVAIEISVSIDELRRITSTQDKLERYSSFKAKVIDTAIKEINQKSKYHVTATPYKRGRSVAGFDFTIESQVGFTHRQKTIAPKAKTNKDGQMNLSDFQTGDNTFIIT